jgi:hypothetical protein
MLYTYSKGTNESEKLNYLYNMHLTGPIETDLKFFYPVPYAAIGVDKYDYCNIVTLNDDVQLMALLSPAPQSRGGLKEFFQVNNSAHPGMNYYDNGLTNPCPGKFNYDLCINTQMMKDLNIEGYVSLALMDTISEGSNWKGVLRNNQLDKTIIEEFIYKSCMNSFKKTSIQKRDSNSGLIHSLYPDINEDDRIFGIPEIAITPIKSSYFFTSSTKRNTDQIFTKRKNYINLATVKKDEMKNYLDSIPVGDILQNLQSPLFHIYKAEKDPKYPYFKDTIMSVRDIEFKDIDFEKCYQMNGFSRDSFTAFEVVLHDILKAKTQQPTSGGALETLNRNKEVFKSTRQIKNKNPKHKNDYNIQVDLLKKQDIDNGMDNNKIILQMTKHNIPILFM